MLKSERSSVHERTCERYGLVKPTKDQAELLRIAELLTLGRENAEAGVFYRAARALGELEEPKKGEKSS